MHIGKKSSCIAIDAQLVQPRCRMIMKEGNVPEARLAVTCSGEDLSSERDFSAACIRETISGIACNKFTTHLTDVRVLPPRLAGQGLGGSSKRRKDMRPDNQAGCDTPEAL